VFLEGLVHGHQVVEFDGRGWYELLEDTRQKYGGAYAGCMSVLDLSNENGNAVLWHDRDQTRLTIWNFVEREVVLPGTVTDATAGCEIAASASYRLAACHTYVVTGARELPRRL